MSNSFTNQVLAQLDLAKNEHENRVYTLPKKLDEEVARLHLARLGAHLTTLTQKQIAIIRCSYKANFSRVHQLTAQLDGKIVALAELHDPDYKDPSVLSYILHGWLKVYLAAGTKRVNDWIAMDAAASQPCHDYQKTAPSTWYLSSLSTDPSMQGIGLGTKLMDYYENYIRERGGKQVVLVTNSQKNLNFYLKRGYELFDEHVFEYEDHKMGSWSLKKAL